MEKKDQIREVADDNLARVDNLIRVYEVHLLGTGRGRRPVSSSDVLRAAVVFLHATLEDFLRSVAEWKLPLASQDVLKDIPLVGQKGRAEKFYLGDLVKHRNKTIHRLFKESVSAYLEKSNYNNIGEVKHLLKSCSIGTENVSKYFNDLGKLMARRHHIVHRIDRNDRPGRGHHRAKPINHGYVHHWRGVVSSFITEVLNEI